MKKSIVLKGQVVEYELTIKAVKRLNLCVKPDLRVLVSAYPSASEKHIEDFVRAHQNLVLNALRKYANEQKISTTSTFNTADTVLLLGRNFPLVVQKANKNSMTVQQDCILLCVKNPDDENLRKKVYTKWERTQLENVIRHECPTYLAKIAKNVSPEIKFKTVKSYWGLCSHRNGNYTITFNTALIHLPIEVIRYVVAHEHAHLVHMNHSNQFYNLLQTLYPNYAEQKRKLKDYTYLLR